MSDELAQQILAELSEIRGLLKGSERRMPDAPMTPGEFARVIGKSPKTVHRWIASGKLKARVEGRVKLITPVNAQRFLNPATRGEM